MKIVFPKEMKIRTVTNLISFVIAGLATLFAVLMLVDGINAGMFFVYLILALVAAGLYFLMAKVMWSLKKKDKAMGKVLITIIAVIGIFSGIMVLVDPLVGTGDILGYSITYIAFIAGAILDTSLLYWAEGALIKKKYLVYS